MSDRLNRFIHNKSGSAAVMVLCVIMILTVLGSIALMGSVSSIKMGNRYRNWTKDFYALDLEAEENVNEIDKLLKQAEQEARAYMEAESFSDVGFSDVSSTDIFDFNSQKFFLDYCWMNDLNNVFETYFANYMATPGATENDAINAYKNALKVGYQECFEKVYLFYAANKLKVNLPTQNVTEKDQGLGYSLIEEYCAVSGKNWNNYTIDNAGILLNISIIDSVNTQKSVQVELKVINPEYKTIVQSESQSIKGNPLWGYALATGGGITVGDGSSSELIQISGDIAASGSSQLLHSGDLRLIQNGRLNVYGNIYANGNVSISGNSAKLIAFNHNSSTTPDPTYNNLLEPVYDKKRGIYNGSELGIDELDPLSAFKDFSTNFSTYIEQRNPPPLEVPFFYRDLWMDAVNGNDIGWGNVYCKNLMIDEDVTDGQLLVDGNVITSDDVEMNGKQNNTITIGSNYIGISSEGVYETLDDGSLALDPNASSTIINNQVMDGSVDLNNLINLKGDIIVPGTAFREFDGASPDTNSYYQTIESVTGRDRAIFDAYTTSPDDPDVQMYRLTTGGVTDLYPMKSLETIINDRRYSFYTYPFSSEIKTNIIRKDDMKGYSLGAVVAKIGTSLVTSISILGNNPLDGYSENQVNYGYVKNWLSPFFEAKTMYFGFNRLFTSLVDTDYISPVNGASVNTQRINAMEGVNMYYLEDNPTGDQEFIIDGRNGIVYCADDNLIIKKGLVGQGDFKGIILAKGNITLDPSQGSFNIIYDEGVVSSILSQKNADEVRAFFKKGMIGHDDYAFIQDYNAVGATKTVLKCYSIEKWQEVQAQIP